MIKLRIPLMTILVLIMGTPALAQQISFGEIPGIYVYCPRKNTDRCPSAVEEFRHFFPNDQTSPFLLLRTNNTGYLAPNAERTQDLTWSRDQEGHLLLTFDDSRIKTIKFQVNGSLLRNAEEGDLYYMAITNQEWNNPPKEKRTVSR